MKWIIASGLIERSLPDGAILVADIENEEKCYRIHGVAAEIWRRLHESRDLDLILRQIANERNYDEGKWKELQQKAESFVDDLNAKKLLKQLPAPTERDE